MMLTHESEKITAPATEPEIEVLRLEEPPFEVECRELRWAFIVPEVGERVRRFTYDHPTGRLSEIEEWTVVGQAKVHGKAGSEMRNRNFSASGELQKEAYAYGTLEGGMARWLGWWNISDEEKFFTWKDEGFEWDWGATSIRIADVGRFRWLDDAHVERASEVDHDPLIDPNGAGLCLLRVGGREHRCLRVLDLNDPSDPTDSLLEAFVNAEGRTLMTRRYAAPRYPIHSAYCGIRLYSWDGTRMAEDLLRDSPQLHVNGAPYLLWYDWLVEELLA
jgi:hypothetical protein